MRTSSHPRAFVAMLVMALSIAVGPSTWAQPQGDREVRFPHRLARGVSIERGSVVFLSDLHLAYGKANRKTDPVAWKSMVAISDMLRHLPEVSEVAFNGDYYHAPHLNGLSPRQRSAAVVRGLAGFQQRLGRKPLHVVFGNHDVPLKQSAGNGYEPVQAMAASLKGKGIDVIGTEWDRSYKFRLPNGPKINIGHAPNASSGAIARAVAKMHFRKQLDTDRAREKMTTPARPRRGEYVSSDSHVVAYSRGKATVVNLGTAGSGSRPVGDPFIVAVRQPTRGWLFLKPTPDGWQSTRPRGSATTHVRVSKAP